MTGKFGDGPDGNKLIDGLRIGIIFGGRRGDWTGGTLTLGRFTEKTTG